MPLTFNDRLLCKKDMLVLIVLALVDYASSYSKTEEICYGSSYEFPIYYTPPLFKAPIHFKQRGKERVLAVSDGKSLLDRFLVNTGFTQLQDLTEQDDDAVLYFKSNYVKLKIEECQDPQTSSYGDLFSWSVPSYVEYIEFSQMTSSKYALEPIVIWNRTDASVSKRGRIKRNYFEMSNLRQKDSGYYKCMGAKGNLLQWQRLIVKEYHRYVSLKFGDNLDLHFPMKLPALFRLNFKSHTTGYEETFGTDSMPPSMIVTDSYFGILHVHEERAGIYNFTDMEGFVALQLELDVENPPLSIFDLPGWVYFVALLVIALFLVCCCCVKKCCCKKSSNKRSSAETDAPPVFYHDTTQPSQPEVPLLSREPRAIRTDPPAYNPSVGNVELPPPTQISVPGGLDRSSTPVFSGDSDQRFELKGSVFPSAPPLSSGTDIQDVYTSDKLNFL